MSPSLIRLLLPTLLLASLGPAPATAAGPEPKTNAESVPPSRTALFAGHYDESLRLATAELAAARAAGDQRRIVLALREQSSANNQLADYSAALTQAQEAVALAEPLGDDLLLALAYNAVGTTHGRLRDWTKSLPWHERALALRERQQSPDVRISLSALGFVHRNLGHLDVALQYFERALPLARESGSARDLGHALTDMGEVLNDLGRYADAVPFLEEAVPLREEKVGDPYTLVSSINDLSTAYRALGRTAEARALSARSVAISEQLKAQRIMRGSYEGAAASAAAAGDYAAAYEFQRKSSAAAAADLNEQRVRDAAVLEKRFDTARKEQQIALLTRDQQLNAAARARAELTRDVFIAAGLAALLIAGLALTAYRYKQRAATTADLARAAAELRAERAQLTMLRYQLNPHLLFNTLNSIRSLALTDPGKARDLVSRLAAFCRRILLPENPAAVPLRDEWAALTDYLELEKARWEDLLTVEAALDPALGDIPVPPLLLQPLVENAIKYGQQTTTGDLRVRVAAVRENGAIVLTVANTGRWVEPAAAPGENSTHVGLANVRQRLAALHGDRAAVTAGERDGWVEIRLQLPVP